MALAPLSLRAMVRDAELRTAPHTEALRFCAVTAPSIARSILARVSSGFGTVLSMAPVIGPSMKVGCTELQRTGGLLRAPDSATDLVSRRTPPFERSAERGVGEE